MRATLTLLFAITMLAAALPVVPPAHAAGVTVAVVEFQGAYASEAWKDESAPANGELAGTPVPVGGLPGPGERLGVYSNPYANATKRHDGGPINDWGYSLTLAVELQDANGEPLTEGNYLIEARIPTPSGAVPAKLAKTGAATFTARFDLDGENGRGDFPALTADTYGVVMDVYRLSDSDPTIARQRIATATHAFQYVDAYLAQSGVHLPETIIPGYTDIAPGETALFHPTRIDPAEDLPVQVTFTGVDGPVKGQTAEIVFVNERTPTVVKNGTTDANGRLVHTTQPSTAMNGGVGALLLLEAHLTGENNTLGNAVIALPVSSRDVRVTSIDHEARAPAGQRAERFDTVAVAVRDANGTAQNAARSGDLHVMRGSTPVTSARFNPVATGEFRTARFPAADLLEGGAPSQYALLAFMVGENGKFYSFTTATRGVAVVVDADRPAPGSQGLLRVTVRNFNDNFDGADDPGLGDTFAVSVTGLPGGQSYDGEITLPERGEGVIEIPFRATAEGSFSTVVNVTAGDVSAGRTYELLVSTPPNAFDAMLEKVPGPGALLTALAVVGAAALVASRQRRA